MQHKIPEPVLKTYLIAYFLPLPILSRAAIAYSQQVLSASSSEVHQTFAIANLANS